jgi:hypothetical protein
MELHGVVEEPRALANDCRLNREADVLFANCSGENVLHPREYSMTDPQVSEKCSPERIRYVNATIFRLEVRVRSLSIRTYGSWCSCYRLLYLSLSAWTARLQVVEATVGSYAAVIRR